MRRIINAQRSVIVAADVPDLPRLSMLATAMKGIPGIGGFKLGLILGLRDLARAVTTVKEVLGPDFPVIFDLQKGGNDIPDMGEPFAKTLAHAGVDAAILFPFAGPATQESWTKQCFNYKLQVLAGGVMTHPKFLVSEGGYIADEAVLRIYSLACDLGVEHFVVPGTKLNWVRTIRQFLIEKLGDGNFTLNAPGFIKQGGSVSDCGQAAGEEWHAIIGTAIYQQETAEAMRHAAMNATSQITAQTA